MISTLFSAILKIAPVAFEFVQNRTVLKVALSSDGVHVPTVKATIYNRSSKIPATVHSVRVHFGSKLFSRALHLSPWEPVTIPPKGKAVWHLSFKAVRLTERWTQRAPSADQNPRAQPGIDRPEDLFNAVGMGDRKASWIEIDFNEFEQHRFKRGLVQPVFDLVGRQHRQLRQCRAADADADGDEAG